MRSSRKASAAPRRLLWAGLAIGGLLPSVGCQVEYAGMTLPSGKYMMDDVQYFPPGPEFPWANTQAATQRARMQAMGYDVSNIPLPGQGGGPLGEQPPAEGALDPTQNRLGRPTDVNASPLSVDPPPGTPENAPNPDAPEVPTTPDDGRI